MRESLDNLSLCLFVFFSSLNFFFFLSQKCDYGSLHDIQQININVHVTCGWAISSLTRNTYIMNRHPNKFEYLQFKNDKKQQQIGVYTRRDSTYSSMTMTTINYRRRLKNEWLLSDSDALTQALNIFFLSLSFIYHTTIEPNAYTHSLQY